MDRGRVDLQDEAMAFCAAQFPRLVRGLTFYVGSQPLAEELAQEALLRACDRWEHVRGLDAPGAWCRRVAMNLATSQLRRRQLERRTRQRLATMDQHNDPDTAAAIVVREAVAGLPIQQRTAVVLRFVHDLSVRATAQEMGLSDDAVKSLTKRATATLREQLGEPVNLSGHLEDDDA